MTTTRHLVTLGAMALAVGLLVGHTGQASARSRRMSAILKATDAKLGTQRLSYRAFRRTATPGEDKTLAPYFYVAGGDPEKERLPLQSTSAKVTIAGTIAQVKVTQVFKNHGQKPIEAVYVFPASTRAAVHGMRMKIGQRTVVAKIEERKKARQQYEQAKQEGRRASLLEQERANVFTMSVANIMPGDIIRVELDYSELLIPEDATYEFVYPTVVGPRYGGGAHPKKDKWIANPYLKEGQPAPYAFNIQATLLTGIPIKRLSSPSHRVDVQYASQNLAQVKLKRPGAGGNRDFVLRYQLAGNKIETGLLMHRATDGGYFVLMMEPPKRPTLAQIPPREYVFLLDISGSMHGFPLDTAKVLMKNLLTSMRRTDYFNIAFFAGSAFVMSPQGSVPATRSNIEGALRVIGRQRGSGGTELMDGLRRTYAIPRPLKRMSRTVVVVTDGYVGVEAQTFKFIRERLDEANLFAFGIGSSVNRGLIEGMARAGQGEPFVVLKPAQAPAQAEKLRRYIEAPVLTHINVSFRGLQAYDVAPRKVPDLLAKRPIIVFGKYRGEPRGTIWVSGYSGGGRIARPIQVTPAAVKLENAPIRYLWARKWAGLLNDQLHILTDNHDLKAAITNLGLSYNLLTQFTSFVAIDSQVVNRTGKVDKVKQPLPLPQGVSNLAVGGSGKRGYVASPSSPIMARRHKMKVYAAEAAPPPAKPSPRYRRPAATRSGGSLGARGRGSSGGALGGLRAPMAKDADRADESRRQARIQALTVSATPIRLGNHTALLTKVERALRHGGGCVTKAGTITIRLTVDSSGKVISVQVRGAGGQASCIRRKLKGMTSSARPKAGATATLEITLRFTGF